MANTKIKELTALLNTVPAGQLTENAVQTYLNILNIDIVEKGSTPAAEVKSEESPNAKVSRLIAEAKKDVNDNTSKYGFGERYVRDNLNNAARYVGRKEYKYAYNELNYSDKLAANFSSYPELMAALAELIWYMISGIPSL